MSGERNDIAKSLISIVGPTAVGKTAISIKLAKELDTEIISADSRQYYKEMEIGTAKPTSSERSQAKHHFINSLTITQEYNAGTFETEALALLEEIFKLKNQVIMTGGSGLYCKAVWEGFDELPKVDTAIRETLNHELKTYGLDHLVAELFNKDPEYYEMVDKNNPQRVVRALEVIRTTGKTFTSFRKNQGGKSRFFKNIKIGLTLERDELYRRIDERMDAMISGGLFKEAERLYPFRRLNALQTVGYSEIFDYLDGIYDYEEAVRLLKRNSRRYAKRQLTWFKRDEEIRWFSPDDYEDLKWYVLANC